MTALIVFLQAAHSCAYPVLRDRMDAIETHSEPIGARIGIPVLLWLITNQRRFKATLRASMRISGGDLLKCPL